MKRQGVKSALFLSVALLAGACASKPAAPERPAPVTKAVSLPVAPVEVAPAPVIKPKPQGHRHLAWLEGDLQNDYSPNRSLAAEKLKRWEGKAPEMTDTNEYLEYLATLDASGRGNEAVEKTRQFLQRFPGEKRAVFLLGAHYLRGGRKELAHYLFSQLEKDPQFPWKALVLNNLGMMALQDKNRQAAIGYLERAAEAKPASAIPLVNLGALYLQSHSYADAEKLFARARQLDPEFEDAALGLGASFEGQGKYEEAHRLYGEFISDNPDALSVVYNDAVILGNRLKRRDEAAPLMQRYIQRGGKEAARANEIIQNWR